MFAIVVGDIGLKYFVESLKCDFWECNTVIVYNILLIVVALNRSP